VIPHPSFDQEVMMKTKLGITMMVPVLLLALTVIAPASAQDSTNSSNSSTQSMPKADQSAPGAIEPAPPAAQSGGDAASSTGQAVESMAHEAATKVKDSTITAKVKIALHQDKDVGNNTIHVSTAAGVVTLKGEVRDPEAAKRAEDLAQQTVGVKRVANQLTVINTGAMN
jgi:hyperosmotically inducible protein